MPPLSIGDLFRERPVRWGLRGDPHLWWDMRERLADTALPETAEELGAIVAALFQELTGMPLSRDKPFYVEKYSHGGLSSGGIFPEFWRDTAIPLLQQRLAETRGRQGVDS